MAFVAVLTSSMFTDSAYAFVGPLNTTLNKSDAPEEYYGGCGGTASSSFQSKTLLLAKLGIDLHRITAITVLECGPANNGGVSGKVPCPAGTFYETCIAEDNDGFGNAVVLGVLRRNKTTDIYGPPPGCPVAGQIPRIERLFPPPVSIDPRTTSGVVTLSCKVSTTPFVPPNGSAQVVPCPAEPNPYAYCARVLNDGIGNDLTVGVVAANGPGDPFGRYGECGLLDPKTFTGEVMNGYPPKIMIAALANQDITVISEINLLACSKLETFGVGFPKTELKRVDCAAAPYPNLPATIANRYDYCIIGADQRRNGVIAGVITRD